MKYYCFYENYDELIANAIVIVTNDEIRINTIHRVLTELGYKNRIVDDIDEFVEWAESKTNQIKILIL